MITFSHLGGLGRLGNQLFQYAALRGLGLKNNYETKIPDPASRLWHGQSCLLGNFNIESDFYTRESLSSISQRYMEPSHMDYDENFFSIPDNTDLYGFFQSTLYFQGFEKQIKTELAPKKEWIEQGDLFQNKVNCYAVGYTDTPEKEIAEIINQPLGDEYESILNTSKTLLKDHIQVQWD